MNELNQTDNDNKIDIIFSDDKNMPPPDKYQPLSEEQNKRLDEIADKIAARFGLVVN